MKFLIWAVAFSCASQALAIDFKTICPILENKPWAEIIAGSTEFTPAIPGKSSGVLNDKGSRKFLEKNIPDCGEGRYGISLRLTQDRVGERGVYEVFVKSQKNDDVIGVAVNNLGQEIPIVPPDVATDKTGLYGSNEKDRRIRGREGCFRCHGNKDDSVSYVFGVRGAEEFWKSSRPVKNLAEEGLPAIAVKEPAPAKPPTPAKVVSAPKPESEYDDYRCWFDYKKTYLQSKKIDKGAIQGWGKNLDRALTAACYNCSLGPERGEIYVAELTDIECKNPVCKYKASPVPKNEVEQLMKNNDCNIWDEKYKRPAQ